MHYDMTADSSLLPSVEAAGKQFFLTGRVIVGDCLFLRQYNDLCCDFHCFCLFVHVVVQGWIPAPILHSTIDIILCRVLRW